MLNKAKEKLTGKKDPIIGNLKGIESPVIEKLITFTNNKSKLQLGIQLKRDEIQALKNKRDDLELEYLSNGQEEKVLKEIIKIRGEIKELVSLANEQEDMLLKNPKLAYCALYEEDKESLIKGFEPIRAKQDELLARFFDQINELENTLGELKEERDKVEKVFANLYQLISSSSGDKVARWAEVNLEKFPSGDVNRKLNQLSNGYSFESQAHIF
jgi:hypothetical protein